MPDCCGLDHHSGEYTPQQRQDLERVLSLNQRIAAAIDDCRDVSGVEALLDPDPLRYMWVDEGGGRLPGFLGTAEQALAAAPLLAGQRRGHGDLVDTEGAAARPALAVRPDGRQLHCWLRWQQDAGEQVVAVFLDAAGRVLGDGPEVISGAPADCFRPTAAFDAEGRAWVAYARAQDGAVAVWCHRHDGTRWSAPELVSTTAHPSFNQELVSLPGGGMQVCWQGRQDDRFTIFTRRWTGQAWSPTLPVSHVDDGNVWDPAVAALPDGSLAFAWTEYRDGSYRVSHRVLDPGGRLGPVRPLSAGSDYALHPSLAVTTDGAVWCAFDVLTVHGHGGSGPTRLRPVRDLGQRPAYRGMRPSGDFVPPELLPEVAAAIRVVRIGDDHLSEAAGVLAQGLDVVPSALPKLVADGRGGLHVAYRIHRRLPLMTYYWEVATQSLGARGWGAPTTYAGSDGGAEEVTVAGLPDGARIAWQSDGRLERGLTWSEGFGGRECPHLLEHHGDVIWHGMHGPGVLRTAVLAAGSGPAAEATVRAHIDLAAGSERREDRRWLGAERSRRTVQVAGTDYTLFWGDLHRHSLVSRCTAGDEPSLEDFYRYSWDVCEYDFWAVTDHSENSSAYQWWGIQKIADLFRVDGRFTPLYGFEWTGMTGHQNVIFGDVARGAPIYSAYAAGSTTPDGLWANLRKDRDYPAITIPHHPGSAMVPFDWDYYDPDLMRLVEVFQACRGNYEFDGCFRQYSDGTLPGTFVVDGLRRGHRYGLIASSDHGHGASYVGAYAERLDRAGIFDALQARRVFAATTRGVVADLRIGDTFMGGETALAGPLEISAFAQGYTDLARVDLVRNGVTLASVQPTVDLPPGWVTVPLRIEWGRGHATTDWSGTLTVDGGEVVATPFWSGEVTEVSRTQVSWVASTKSFGVPYGAQRGGLDLTLTGPPDARVRLRTAPGEATLRLADLVEGPVDVPVRDDGRLRLQPGTGGLTSLGVRALQHAFRDDPEQDAWYYLRVFQVDGEMAWSSPIWVSRRPGGPGD